MLHLIAGPVDAKKFLQEARWVIESCKLAQLEERGNTLYKLQKHFRMEHVQRLRDEHHAPLNYRHLPHIVAKRTAKSLGDYALMDRRLIRQGLNNEGKVHKILAYYPLPRVSQIYRAVFEGILKEKIETRPVVVKN